MSKIDYSRLFDRKQKMISDISETKNRGMEFSNALNNAVAVWSVLENRQKLTEEDATKAAKDLMEWVRFFLALKDEVKPEEPEGPKATMTGDQAAKETQEVFAGSVQKPATPGGPLCSEPQTKKIWVELHRLGYKDENHLDEIETILRLPEASLKSMKDLTKKQASTVIEKLIKIEANK